MDRPPRVTFIAGTLGPGGAEQQLAYMALTLRDAGVCPQVLSLRRGEAWEARLVQAGIPVTWVGAARTPLGRLRAILKVSRNDPPDVFQSGHFFTNLYAWAAGRRLRRPSIGAVRSDLAQEWNAHGWLGRQGLYRPRVMAVNSKAALARAEARGVPRDRLVWVPNVVDTDRFRPRDRTREGPFRVAWIGRLAPPKRPDRFLEVLSRLDGPEEATWQASIVGDGPLREELTAQVQEAGLASKVRFLGHRPDVRSVLAETDVLVSTSDHEGTPNVVMEALAMEVPVVATDVGGTAEVLTHGVDGWIREPQDPSALAKDLRALLADPERARTMGQAGRRSMQSTRSLPALRASLEGLYQHALR